MNNRALTLSLLMAAVAVFFVYSYVDGIEEATRKKFGTEVIVLKANRDIKEMETINETMIERKPVPKEFLEPSAIKFEANDPDDKEVVKSMKNLVGYIAIVPIRKGEQITYSQLSEPSMRTGLAPQIAPGKRAMSFPVNDVTGVSKLLKPGDRIDIVIVTGKDQKVAKTVLQDIVVLATGRAVTNNVPRTVEMDPNTNKEKVKSLVDDFSFATVTVEVDPTQAPTIALLGQDHDTTSVIVLRNNDDTERTNTNSVTIPDLLGADAGRTRNPAGGR